MRVSTLGLSLLPGRWAQGGADKRCKHLQNSGDGILGRANGQRIDIALPACMVIAAVYDA
jgi:hypothetical protein